MQRLVRTHLAAARATPAAVNTIMKTINVTGVSPMRCLYLPTSTVEAVLPVPIVADPPGWLYASGRPQLRH